MGSYIIDSETRYTVDLASTHYTSQTRLAFGLKVELGPSFAVLDLDEKVGLAQFGLAVKSGSFLWAVGYVKLVR